MAFVREGGVLKGRGGEKSLIPLSENEKNSLLSLGEKRGGGALSLEVLI